MLTRYTVALLAIALALPAAPAGSEIREPAGMTAAGTNAVLPTARTNLGASPTVNVKTDYGAKADGVADDAAAINTALTAGAGGSVMFPIGTYLHKSPLVVPSGTRVVCEKGATIVAPSVGWTDPSPDPVNGAHKVHFLNQNHGNFNNVTDTIV